MFGKIFKRRLGLPKKVPLPGTVIRIDCGEIIKWLKVKAVEKIFFEKKGRDGFVIILDSVETSDLNKHLNVEVPSEIYCFPDSLGKLNHYSDKYLADYIGGKIHF